MELHPILEQDTCPNPGLWYVVSAVGESPSLRVGHTCTFIKNQNGGNGRVYVIGGANPSGCFNDTYVLDLDQLNWDTVDTSGFCSRYEHAAFVAESQPDKIYVFGGANQSGNLNDIQVLDTVSSTWSTVSVNGEPPSARTYHVSACVGDKFIVYSGGQSGADPIGDRQVHCFDVSTLTWTTLTIKGDPPKPRHGHVVVAIGNKVFIHGGMSGTTFYDDLHILDLDKRTWSSVKQKKGNPGSRAAHGGVAHDNSFYVFGGMNKDGALHDVFKFDVASMKWSNIVVEDPPPASRLDFAICTVQCYVSSSADSDLAVKTQEAKTALDAQMEAMKIGDKGVKASVSLDAANTDSKDNGEQSPESSASPSNESLLPSNESSSHDEGDVLSGAECSTATKCVTLCFVTGGMDTQGEIFDDCMVMVL